MVVPTVAVMTSFASAWRVLERVDDESLVRVNEFVKIPVFASSVRVSEIPTPSESEVITADFVSFGVVLIANESVTVIVGL